MTARASGWATWSPIRAQPAAPARGGRGGAGAAGAAGQHVARRLPAHDRDGEGIHPRRRDLPGRAVDAPAPAVPPAALLALSCAPAPQPLALPVLPRIRRLLGGRRIIEKQ